MRIVKNPNDSTYLDSDDESDIRFNDSDIFTFSSEMQKILKSAHSHMAIEIERLIKKRSQTIFWQYSAEKVSLKIDIRNFIPK